MSLLLREEGDLLFYVALNPGITTTQLQLALGFGRSRMYRAIKALRAQQLIETRPQMRRRKGQWGRRRGCPPNRCYACLDVLISHPCLANGKRTTLRKLLASIALQEEII